MYVELQCCQPADEDTVYNAYVSEYVILHYTLFLVVSIKLPFIVNTLSICMLVLSSGANLVKYLLDDISCSDWL